MGTASGRDADGNLKGAAIRNLAWSRQYYRDRSACGSGKCRLQRDWWRQSDGDFSARSARRGSVRRPARTFVDEPSLFVRARWQGECVRGWPRWWILRKFWEAQEQKHCRVVGDEA